MALLYSAFWKPYDELSQYQTYVLVLLFVKYLSDKYANDLDDLIDASKGFLKDGNKGRLRTRRSTKWCTPSIVA